jgi:hypothetical protein
MYKMACNYTAQGSLVCNDKNDNRDPYIKTQFTGACLLKKGTNNATIEGFQYQNQKTQQEAKKINYNKREPFTTADFSFENIMKTATGGLGGAPTRVEKFGPVNGHDSVDVTSDFVGSYSIPFSPL